MSPGPDEHSVFGSTTVGGATVSKECSCIKFLLNLLGDADGDLCFFLPFLEGTLGAGADVQDLSSRGLHASNIVAVDNVPVIRGDLLSVRLNSTDEYMAIPDNVLLTPIAAGIDVAFSVGCAFKLAAADANIKCLISKWDDTGEEEWRFGLTALEYPEFQISDDDVAGANMGREDQTAVAASTWYIIIGTYDGRGGAACNDGMNIYRWDGVTRVWDGVVDDANIDGGGVYIDMEDNANDVNIGASFAGGAASEFWPGEMMMPWYTRRELTAADAERAALLMVRIMGL